MSTKKRRDQSRRTFEVAVAAYNLVTARMCRCATVAEVLRFTRADCASLADNRERSVQAGGG